MSLGVLNNISALYAENSLNQTQNSLQSVLQQLSSGQRINSGADDPAGLAVADGLAANEAALTQSAANATDGVGFLQTADGALAQVTNLLDSAVSIATEAANGTLTSAQVSSANQEYQNILSEIADIGSTTNFNSTSVFSSTATNIFVSDGSTSGTNNYADTVGVLTEASVGTTTASSTATTTAITNPTATAPTTSTGGAATFALASSSDTISGTISVAVGGDSAISVDLGSTGVSLAAAADTLNADSAFSGADLVASVGTGTDANELIITGPESATVAGTGSAISVPAAVNTYESSALTNPTPTASTTSAGSTATFSLGASTDTVGGTLDLSYDSGNDYTATITAGSTVADVVSQLNGDSAFTAAGYTAAQGTGANANELIITGPEDTGTPGTNTLDVTGTSLTDTSTTTVSSSTSTFALNSTSDTIGGTLHVAVGSNSAQSYTITAGSSLAAAVSQLNGDSAFTNAGLTAAVGTGANDNKLIITADNSQTLTGTSLTDTTAVTTSDPTLDVSGSSLDDTTPANTTGAGVDFTTSTISTLTADTASTVLTSVTAAIADVSYQRGTIGADINELTAASNVASAEQVNLASAQNSILATDYGQATSDLSKYQVLSQTGISALAQANSVSQEVLKLLQ